MNPGAAKLQIDDLLLPFLVESSEAESEAILEELVLKHAQPLIRNIISFKLRASSARWTDSRDRYEVEDISNEVIVRLVRTLRACKSSPREKPITSLRGYVAAMAYNALDEYLRQKYPRRFSLKNRIRYILTHQPGLTLWEGGNRKTLCGFARWSHLKKAEANSLLLARSDLDDFLHKTFPATDLKGLNPTDLVAAVCEFAGSPLEIDDLVTVLAEILGIRDAPPLTELGNKSLDNLPQLSFDPRRMIDEKSDYQGEIEKVRIRLQRVWIEIVQLPLRQRMALLLNLRDENGGAAITLLPMLRIASIQQIAEALEMSSEELADIWNKLPLDDAAISEKLGATRQQIANLRKCARERLSRRSESSGKV
ncbi:MAG: hypothetical protein ND866_04130 [Pyrinomonadaceae bacterium]|nr:hypothetical protein [Pyrinomonadaceae bacterium]